MSPKPMLTEDYLIRQINLAIAALAKILGLKTAGQFQAALYEIDQLLEQLIGLRSYMIKNLSDEGILAILSNAEGVDTDRLLIVADLIKHEGDILAEKKYAEERCKLCPSPKFLFGSAVERGTEVFRSTRCSD